jgi:hypothetical protein
MFEFRVRVLLEFRVRSSAFACPPTPLVHDYLYTLLYRNTKDASFLHRSGTAKEREILSGREAHIRTVYVEGLHDSHFASNLMAKTI